MQILFAALLMLPLIVARGRSKSLWVLFVLPVLALCTLDALAQWLLPLWGDWQRIGLVALPAAVGLLFGYPLLVRLAMPSVPLDEGPLRNGLQTLASRWRFAPDRIFVWNTGGRAANAAVCGLARPLRYVFLSDELIRRLSSRQIDAVFAHEVGHAIARHLLLRMAVMAAPLVALAAFCQWSPLPAGSTMRFWTFALVLPALFIVYAATVLSACARGCEFEADLLGVRLLANDGAGQPAVLQAAYGQMIDSLAALAQSNPQQACQATWLHPALATRIALLRRAAREPEIPRRYCRRQRYVRWSVAGLYALALASFLMLRLG